MSRTAERNERLERRSARAAELVANWINGNRHYVIRELGMHEAGVATRSTTRLIAAIAVHGFTSAIPRERSAAFEIMEWITWEKGQ